MSRAYTRILDPSRLCRNSLNRRTFCCSTRTIRDSEKHPSSATSALSGVDIFGRLSWVHPISEEMRKIRQKGDYKLSKSISFILGLFRPNSACEVFSQIVLLEKSSMKDRLAGIKDILNYQILFNGISYSKISMKSVL